jgi:hypothetical protein
LSLRTPNAWLATLFFLLPGCNCGHTDNDDTECSSAVMAQAQSQVDSALAGNTSCTVDSDCILVQSPCEVIENCCGFDFSAVNRAGEAAVEHAFSVTAAEVCSTCTPEPTNDSEGDGADCSTSSIPAAVCSGNLCTVVPAVPDGGSFEWACGFSCVTENDYCDIEDEETFCAFDTSYVSLPVDGGVCFPIAGSFGGGLGTSCTVDTDCGLGFNCNGADLDTGQNGTCSITCPTTQPTVCDGGCQLTLNNHDCNVCFCPNGCPTF